MKHMIWAGVVGVALVCGARAEVQPHPLFTDGAVLQRGVSIPVWGTAKAGEKVTVELCGKSATATAAADGKWMAKLGKCSAGGPFKLVIRGENTITLTNVCVGEVWVCSGQSNMEWPLRSAENGAQVIPNAADPQLRLFHVPKNTADTPQTGVKAVWQVCEPKSVESFSAVGYFFGRDLRKALNIPVGLIESDWGGTYAETWTDHATLQKVLPEAFARQAEAVGKWDPVKAKAQFEQAKAKHKEAVAKAKAEGKPEPRGPRMPADPSTGPNRPCALFNGMIAPLLPYPICGAIWYQGESNNGRQKEYQTLFPAMIGNWRKVWGCGDFPFLFVQIAPHEGMTPELREAQFIAMQKTPNTAMAVITDHGTPKDIHPKAKEPVGGRLALAARALAYGEKIEYSGPVFKKMKVSGGKAVLSFDHLGGGLVAKDGALKGFTIAGVDKKFVPAEAVIEGDTVVVSSAEVKQPVAVRYGWSNVPDVNLFNKADLPATPFRTDVEK
jgi:sialate O-acetylesterase